MSYYTVKDEASFEFEEKKSIFIGNVKRVTSEEEAKEFIAKIKNKYKDARHNVFAYAIGENMGVQRYSDDGEPQGTAGIPTLDVIKNKAITDVAVVVTRYFGGILLGTGGLARAYSKAASEAINNGNIVLKVMGKQLAIDVNYDLLGKIQYAFEQRQWFIDKVEYTDKVSIISKFETDHIEEVKKCIMEIASGNCSFSEENEKYYFKMENKLF
jgi:uncharacterized YigZ family protein